MQSYQYFKSELTNKFVCVALWYGCFYRVIINKREGKGYDFRVFGESRNMPIHVGEGYATLIDALEACEDRISDDLSGGE